MLSSRTQRGTDVNLRSAPQLAEYRAIADRLAADHPDCVLDWGCGWGQVSALLHERGLDVASFDFRPEAGEDGRRRLTRYPEIEAWIAAHDPVRLPYADGEFDAVLSCGVLEHVAEPDASLEEIRRVLRPGGTFYVFKLPNRFSYLEAIARRVGLYYHGADVHDRVYTKRTALALLGRHGFAVRELRRTNLLPLTLPGPVAGRLAPALWAVNRTLARLPGLNLVATNLELVATASR